MHPLQDAYYKLTRAKEHLDRAVREAHAYISRDCAITRAFDASASEFVYRAVVRAEPPVDIALSVGDFAHDLRCTYDHPMWQLAIKKLRDEGQDGDPDRSTAFPMFRSNVWQRKRVELPAFHPDRPSLKVPADTRQYIETLQPYHGFDINVPGRSVLAVLAAISNTDKHRRLPVLTSVVTLHGLAYSRLPSIEDEQRIREWKQGPVSNGDVFARIQVVPNDDLEILPRAAFEVGLAVPGVDYLPIGVGGSLFNLETLYRVTLYEVMPVLSRFFPDDGNPFDQPPA